jgi:hypothetical protein
VAVADEVGNHVPVDVGHHVAQAGQVPELASLALLGLGLAGLGFAPSSRRLIKPLAAPEQRLRSPFDFVSTFHCYIKIA